MVTKTPNLGLNKPAGTDLVDIAVLNANMDILDEKVGSGGGGDALQKTGGAMISYLPDLNVGQVRNIFFMDKKPDDSIGMDGDLCVVPDDVPIEPPKPPEPSIDIEIVEEWV